MQAVQDKLPLEQEKALKVNEEGHGYVPARGELRKTSPYYTGDRKPDVSEHYLLQRDWGPIPRRIQNQWPDGEEEFRQTLMEFFEAAEDLSLRMLPLHAPALDLEPDFFEVCHQEGNRFQPLECTTFHAGTSKDNHRRPS